MQSLNGRTHHVYVIYNDFSMLTGQTSLPPNQPTGLKVKNVHYFGIFQPIWMKLGMQSLNGRTHHVYVIYNDFSMLTGQTSLPPNQPIGSKVKKVFNFDDFQPIKLKVGVKSQDRIISYMFWFYEDLSMNTGQTSLPPKLTIAFHNAV